MIVVDGIMPSDAVMKKMRKLTDTCLMGFSCGKDSVALWLRLRQGGFKVVARFCYMFPDLSFQTQALRYYEKFFGQRIYCYPHPLLTQMMLAGNMMTQGASALYRHASLFRNDFADLNRYMCDDLGYDFEKMWIATGVRYADSARRRTNFIRRGAIRADERQFFPLWDYQKEDMVTLLRRSGVKLAADYQIWGRSFDGVAPQFLPALKKHFPRDYERISEMFPMLRAQFARMHFDLKRGTIVRTGGQEIE